MLPTRELIERCRKAGMRITSQRLAIFECLSGNTSHPTAEEIYKSVKRRHRGLSLATVYNTLETLEHLGEVARYDLGGAAERFDPEVRPHHHFTCRECGAVRDIFGTLEPASVPQLDGYDVESVQVAMVGTCPACRAAAGAKKVQRNKSAATTPNPKQ
jgi:Fur family peroxide stress response transcriptional regulator